MIGAFESTRRLVARGAAALCAALFLASCAPAAPTGSTPPGPPAQAAPGDALEAGSGAATYREVCAACHDTGVADAPRYADREDWEELIEEGQHVLTAHAWVGVRAMPPQGGQPDLSLAEFARATAYMARAAGADWKAPDQAMLDRIGEEVKARRESLAGVEGTATRTTRAADSVRSGEQVYDEVCAACHTAGAAAAPRLGDRGDWEDLIEEGQHVLTAHAWVGVRGMPPRGGSPDLSLEEFARAVAYMARAAGGDWQDPDVAMLEKIRDEEQARRRERQNPAR